jgi:hypothetical protein
MKKVGTSSIDAMMLTVSRNLFNHQHKMRFLHQHIRVRVTGSSSDEQSLSTINKIEINISEQ